MDHLVTKPKIAAIIQARMGSTRLPGKILKNILGEPMLLKLVKRVKSANTLDEIVVATTALSEDDIVEELCNKNGICVFRGDADDVLNRYYFAAKQFDAGIIVRLTGDNPLVDPQIIDSAVSKFLELKNIQSIDYLLTQNYPYGINVEVFSFSTLERAFNYGMEPYEREHVTPFIYRNPNKFNLYFQKYSKDYSAYRLTVDTPEDLKLIETIFNELYFTKEIFLLEDIIKLIEEKPELIEINKGVKQKKLGD